MYGLFVERAVRALKGSGRLALLTQGTFIDKEWAAGLRELLATRLGLRLLVDLNPFGQLFFGAMNTPCVTIGDSLGDPAPLKSKPADVVAVLSRPAPELRDLEPAERGKRVVETVVAAVERMRRAKKPVQVDFATAVRISSVALRDTAARGWDLSGGPRISDLTEQWPSVSRILEPRQGVTPGGCLDVFLMTKEEAAARGLEEDLVKSAVKSREVERWRARGTGRVLLYPYRRTDAGYVPAFQIDPKKGFLPEVRRALEERKVLDALDFDKLLDRREEEIVRRRGVNADTVGDLLKHRIANDLVSYPKAARYLIQSLERLEGRVFEKRRFRELGKLWYEYHRPREHRLMLAWPKIISPTLVKRVRFALDEWGYLSDHGAILLQPTAETRGGFAKLRERVSDALGGQATVEQVLKYCLAFLNSETAQERLTRGQRPTPRGFYAVSMAALARLPIPLPRRKKDVKTILDLVGRLIQAAEERETAALEAELQGVVARVLGAGT